MKKFGICCVIWCCLLFLPMTAFAAQTELDTYDFSKIEEVLDDIFPNEKIQLKDVIEKLINGETSFSLTFLIDLIKEQFFYEIRHSKESFIHILLIAILAAVFSNFSDVFHSKQAAEIGSSIMYLLLVTVCMNSFRVILSGMTGHLEHLTDFMKVLGPVYFLAVAVATGTSTSVSFYQIVLFVILLVEMLILNFLLPVIQIYFVVRILDEFTPEMHLSKFAELIETIVSWTLKTLLASVIGWNVIQRLLTPAIDAVKRSVLTKGGEMLPIVGDAIGGTTEVLLGTAVLIKNGIGVAGMIICIAICLIPLVQMAVITFLYQVIAALIQPISDKRMVECLSSMAAGTKMLLRIVFTTGVLFLLTIAVVATTTGG